MKKGFKSFIALLMVVVMSNVLCGKVSAAAENKEIEQLQAQVMEVHNHSDFSALSTDFITASISVSKINNAMYISITTILNDTASIVGVKDIVIWHKEGGNWVAVATSSGGSVNQTDGMSCVVTYANAIQGDTYKITCTHYGNVDEYRELKNDSGEFKYNF